MKFILETLLYEWSGLVQALESNSISQFIFGYGESYWVWLNKVCQLGKLVVDCK